MMMKTIPWECGAELSGIKIKSGHPFILVKARRVAVSVDA